jgi:hypothetical protein
MRDTFKMYITKKKHLRDVPSNEGSITCMHGTDRLICCVLSILETKGRPLYATHAFIRNISLTGILILYFIILNTFL